jgi:thioester reductase-like protein
MNNSFRRIEALSHSKRELLLQKLKNQNVKIPQTNVINAAMTVEELKAEAQLDDDICPSAEFTGNMCDPSAILLTGATGFIGAFLLDELLQQTQADIYCLVRAADISQAKQRIKNNLEFYLIWDENKSSRIIPIVGDLTQPLLGLSDEQYRKLTLQIDCIYHCGALVKWTYSYKALKAANVLGTKTILRLACETKVKSLCFVSTVGVFSSSDRCNSIITEQEDLDNSGTLYVGYAQSKWISEKMVTIAASRGLPVSIYRPNTEGDSRTGVFNRHDHLCKVLKGCIQLGCAPSDLNMVIAGASIDYVSKAIVYISRQKESLGKVFHLVNPQPLQWSEWLDCIASVGYPLKQLPYPIWKSELMKQVKGSQNNELYSISPIFTDDIIEQSKLPLFDCKNTIDMLRNTSIYCPPLDSKLLSTYFDYFIKSGFLNPPQTNKY